MSITTVIEIPIVTPEELEGKKKSELNKLFLFYHSGSCACAVALNEIGSLNAQNYTCISQTFFTCTCPELQQDENGTKYSLITIDA